MTKEVREARENSSNKGVFALKFFGICCGSGKEHHSPSVKAGTVEPLALTPELSIT